MVADGPRDGPLVPGRDRGKVMGLMGTCYQFGGAFSWALAFFLTGYFVEQMGGDWRSVFLVPSVLFAVVGVFFFVLIRNRPEDVGLPAVNPDEPRSSERSETGGPSISGNIIRTLTNPYIWIVAMVFFLLDVNSLRVCELAAGVSRRAGRRTRHRR